MNSTINNKLFSYKVLYNKTKKKKKLCIISFNNTSQIIKIKKLSRTNK